MNPWSTGPEQPVSAESEPAETMPLKQGEAYPTPGAAVQAILERISPLPEHACRCHKRPNIQVQFPDGTSRTPGISLFCEDEVPDEETSLVPCAVVEVLNPPSRTDLASSAPYYLSQGVKDVLVFDPKDGSVHHFQKDSAQVYTSPVTLELQMGCTISFDPPLPPASS